MIIKSKNLESFLNKINLSAREDCSLMGFVYIKNEGIINTYKKRWFLLISNQ